MKNVEYATLFGDTSYEDHSDSILASLDQLQEALENGTFNPTSFSEGEWREQMHRAQILIVCDPVTKERPWLYLTEAVPGPGYLTLEEALAAALAHVHNNIENWKEYREWHMQFQQEMDESRKHSDREELNFADPSLTLTQPWSITITQTLLYVDENIAAMVARRAWFRLQEKARDEMRVNYEVIVNHDENQVLGNLFLRKLSAERTEVIFVPGEYHYQLALTISSLYRYTLYLEMEDEETESEGIQMYPFDDVFEQYYEVRKEQRITLKQWALAKNISYHWLSRHHKSYRQRKLRKVAES